ncbi:MAG: SUMF1/EgtB/PvdO family nonheme iron enzyme [Bdellovibrio bacteriovorus]
MPTSNTLHEYLIESIVRLPGWGDADIRRARFSDLAWGLGCREGLEGLESPQEAAVSLVDLALASEVDASVDRWGGTVLGLRGLIEDLRELIPSLELDPLALPLARDPPGDGWCECPYPGLLPLEHWQAPIYFGRRAETRALLRRLTDTGAPRIQLVSGVAGCGKSSLLQAGVRGWLATGGLPSIPQAERWLVSSMFPAGYGGDPFLALTHGLARALDPASLDAPGEAALLKAQGAEALGRLLSRVLEARPARVYWLLIIDQLEELFTSVESDLADDFLEMLTASLEQPRLRVLAAIRAERLHHWFARPALIPTVNAGGLFILGSPSRLSLERMVLGPLSVLAPRVTITVDTGLIQDLLDDVHGHPEGLALMAEALQGIHARDGSGGRLTLKAYQEVRRDGLRGGLARRAERALARAGEGARGALDGLFVHLVHVGADEPARRRRADLRELVASPETHRLVQSLSAQDIRLVRVRAGDRPTVELAHEALLQGWPALRDWIKRRRTALVARAEVQRDARAWASTGRSAQRRWRDEDLGPVRACLREAGLLRDLDSAPDTGDFLIPERDWLAAELACGRLTLVQREEVGLRLAQLGDPRPGVGLRDRIPAIRWCAIPSGEVRVEGHGIFPVPALRISAFPVTQAQFESFLDADDGFGRHHWWEGLSRSATRGDRLPRHGNYPATQVSWHDATAFSRWLSERLGYRVRLPDEWEWQWAAQSARPGFVYPWGRDWRDGHANTEEAGLGRVTAVGLLPHGLSLQGAYDLAGNVWEWCRNRYDQPRVTVADTSSPRVLRGGSWRVNRGFARADFRLEGLPEDRMAGSGFRLVCEATGPTGA